MKYRFYAQEESAGVISISGNLDLLTAPALKDQIQGLVTAGFHRLVVDLADVGSIDSSGLSALIGGLRVARVAGGDVRIARPAEPIRSLLHQSTLDAILTPYKSVEDALVGYR